MSFFANYTQFLYFNYYYFLFLNSGGEGFLAKFDNWENKIYTIKMDEINYFWNKKNPILDNGQFHMSRSRVIQTHPKT